MKNYIECPTYDLTCPYCLVSGECIIDNPAEECDDYAAYNEEEEKMNCIIMLSNYLIAGNVPYQVFDHFTGGLQLVYPDRENRVVSAVCSPGTYGYEQNLIEIMGLTENGDEVEGYLTPEEVSKRICNHYRTMKMEEA